MGWFGKDRFGTVHASPDKRTFTWIIDDWISNYGPGAYDSANSESFEGADFHFHLVIANDGDVGVYIHYKSIPIPKYSFFFSCAAGTRSRQHTALNIPPDTERVGHWNVCKKQELSHMLQQDSARNGQKLHLVLQFDDDKIIRTETNESDVNYTWKVPRFKERYLEPFTSTIFLVDGLNYVVRVDKKRGTADGNTYNVFLFSRRSVFPPHKISLVTESGSEVAATELRDDMTTQLLTLPAEAIEAGISKDGTIEIHIEFRKGGNPLDGAFAMPTGNDKGAKSNRPATVPGCEGSSNPYVTVVNDDEI